MAMNQTVETWWPRVLVLSLLAFILCLPLLFGKRSQVVSDQKLKLVIFTPHNEQIRFEMAHGFNIWRKANNLPEVYFDWRTSGGTSDLRKQILDQFTKAAVAGQENEGIGYDMLFGGGDFEHNILAWGVKVTREGKDEQIPILVPVDLSPALLKQAFPEPTIGSERLYHPEMKWVGVVLSAFGIVYNNDLLKMNGQTPPVTWSDLADGRYLHDIALADPAHSGSIAVAYNTILRRYGWDEGWHILRRCFANARYFTNSASQVPIDVSAGQATAGMCIDFYGRFQAQAVGGGRVGYVDPPFMTTITADPIAIFRGAPHLELSQQFVSWLLTYDAQMLWQRKLGEPGGPQKFELRRMPIRRDLYTTANRAQWTDKINPFLTRPFPEGMPDFYRTVALITHAMAIDVHDDLTAAWEAILKNPSHPRRGKMLELFDALPPELEPAWPDEAMARGARRALQDPGHPQHRQTIAVLAEVADRLKQRWRDPDQQLRDRLTWTLYFQKNYQQVVKLSQEK